MRFKIFLLLWMGSLIVPTCFAQTFNKVKLDSLLDALSINHKAMLSLAIRQNGRLTYSRAIGYSFIDTNAKILATPQTRYRIGSISKVFTSVMIFQLIEEGKIKLSTPLAKYFPALPNANKITVANLLNHSSGLHNFTSDNSYLSMLNKKVTHSEMLAIFKNNKADFEPCSKHVYSNTNFVLLGYIIEKLDKKPYDAALKKRIVDKIGLTTTYYGGKINTKKQQAQSYKWEGKWKQDTETDMSIPGGAGAVVSTPIDLTKFMDALFTGKLISDSSLSHMRTIVDHYGMDLGEYPFYDKIGYGHNGGIDGFQSQAVYFPESKLATSYTANGVNTDLNSMMIGVLSIIFNKPYSLPVFTESSKLALTSQDLDKYLGVYASKQLPIKITISKNKTVLLAQATAQPAFPLEATGVNEFEFEQSGIILIFDTPKSQMTLKQGGGTFLFTKEK